MFAISGNNLYSLVSMVKAVSKEFRLVFGEWSSSAEINVTDNSAIALMHQKIEGENVVENCEGPESGNEVAFKVDDLLPFVKKFKKTPVFKLEFTKNATGGTYSVTLTTEDNNMLTVNTIPLENVRKAPYFGNSFSTLKTVASFSCTVNDLKDALKLVGGKKDNIIEMSPAHLGVGVTMLRITNHSDGEKAVNSEIPLKVDLFENDFDHCLFTYVYINNLLKVLNGKDTVLFSYMKDHPAKVVVTSKDYETLYLFAPRTYRQ